MRLYTEEGNWDLVGNDTPVFYLRDPLKFPDLNHVVKRDPHTNLRNPIYKWDFFSPLPESLHQLIIDFSDRGIPKSYRHMHGFGSHTFSFIDAQNQRFWVKFHFRCKQGIENSMDDQAEAIIAKDRERPQRDLFEAIKRRDFPRWKLQIQIMPEHEASQTPYNPFDLTKVWPHGDYPLIDVGFFELNRNPDDYFSEVKQVAMNPANVVPGISFSPDKMLQGRLFSYGDAHRYRLGVNHHQIPVNGVYSSSFLLKTTLSNRLCRQALEVSQQAMRPRQQHLQRDRLLKVDHRHRPLAKLRVVGRYYKRLHNLRMYRQHSLDILRLHVSTAVKEQIV